MSAATRQRASGAAARVRSSTALAPATVRAGDRRRLRRVAVGAAGLHRRAPFGSGREAGARALRHLGYVQVDTISVVRRAHEHIVDARVPRFESRHWNALVSSGDAFEYWAHAAAYLPMEDWRFALPRMARMRDERPFSRRTDDATRSYVIDRIRAEGPLRIRDFEESTQAVWHGWGRYKPSKFALEQLWHSGELMIVARDGFEKTYELTERALPDDVDTRMPTLAERAAHLVDRARRALGVFSAANVTYLRQERALRDAVSDALAEAVEAGALLAVRLPQASTQRTWFVCADAFAEPARVTRAPRFLSPFDPLVLHRERLAALFDFDYQLECYVPAPKRRDGYFALPLLLGDTLVARADCKAQRRSATLQIERLQLEPNATGEIDELAAAIGEATEVLAERNGCTRIRLARIDGGPPSRDAALHRSLEARFEAAQAAEGAQS